MPGLDPRSFLVVSAILGLLCALIFFTLRRSFPNDIKGLNHWGWACMAMVVAACLFALENSLPVLLSSFLADILGMIGMMLMYVSINRFAGNEERHRLLATALVAMAFLLIWITFTPENYRFYVIAVSAVNMAVLMACAVVIQRMQQQDIMESFTKSLFLLMALVSFLRCISGIIFQNEAFAEIITPVFQQFYPAAFSVASIALSLGFMLMVNRRLQLNLERIASRDGLTGTFTRGAYFELVSKEIFRARRSGEPLSLLMVDFDNFKQINDRYGHQAGDQVLIDFVQKVNRVLRAQDIFGRYGGEEFSILLPNTPSADAYRVARRICRLLEEAPMPGQPKYTVSIGTATMQQREHLELDAFVRRADQALYQAKNGGKNRVEMHAGHVLNFA
ncbi:MAG TPA: hypothetical protein DHV59_07090 [Oxalobacteraceae bacterium]|nr:hypothetical protein [Oxalobacteraceae bacterium]